MLLLIFGAGASYDSVPSSPPGGDYGHSGDPRNQFRLPLANDLFDNRRLFAEVMWRLPQCQPVIPYLQRLTGSESDLSIEQRLAALQQEADGYPERLVQLAAIRFYLRCIIRQTEDQWVNNVIMVSGGVTNHRTFLDQVEHWRHACNESVCVVTFNYDTLLERALA